MERAVGADAFAGSTPASIHGIAAPLEAVAQTFAQPWVAPVVALGAVSAMAGVLLNLLLGLSRVLLAMARRRCLRAAGGGGMVAPRPQRRWGAADGMSAVLLAAAVGRAR